MITKSCDHCTQILLLQVLSPGNSGQLEVSRKGIAPIFDFRNAFCALSLYHSDYLGNRSALNPPSSLVSLGRSMRKMALFL